MRSIKSIVGLLLLLLPGAVMAQNGPFLNLSATPVGSGPQAVAVGDLNGDGFPDVVVANNAGATISVLLGNGDGSYKPPTTISSLNGSPGSIAIADLNHDGKPDMVVGFTDATSIEVFLGNGDGTFTPGVSYTTAAGHPSAIQVGDFTGDGILDIAVAVPGVSGPFPTNGEIYLFSGVGNGTFAQPKALQSVPGSLYLGGMVAADLDGNGSLDITFAININSQSGALGILLNDGKGNFTLGTSVGLQSAPSSIAAGDFNGDGHMDLAIGQPAANSIAVLIGNGDGTFQSPAYDAVDQNPLYVVAGDLNADGKTDLITANNTGNTLSVLLGKGDGTFQPVANYATLNGPFALAIGDLNHDGRPDLVVTDNTQNSVQVFLSNTDGTLRTGNYAAGAALKSITSGDFNGDGYPDFAVVGGGTVSIFLGDGHGGFSLFRSFNTSAFGQTILFESIAAGDFNNDGKMDLAVSASGGHYIEFDIYLGNGDGTFQAPNIGGNYWVGNLLNVDLNGDGNLDVLSSLDSQGLEVNLGAGNGAFQSVTLSDQAYGIAVGDFNGDGKLDIATAGYYVAVFLGNGDGTFQNMITTVPSVEARNLTVGDFNGDGLPDLAIGTLEPGRFQYSPDTGPVVILLGNGDGTFHELGTHVSETGTFSAVSDFNGDGIPDLAVSRADKGSVGIFLGKGDGTFVDAADYPVFPDAGAILVADFNLDGAPDLAVISSSSAAVLENIEGKGLTAGTSTQLNSSGPAPVVGEPLLLIASVMAKSGMPTGTVAFKEYGTTFGSSILDAGQSQSTVPGLNLGPHSFTALYTGDTNFNGSLSRRLVITVGPAASTTTVKTSSAGTLGEPVTLTATIKPQYTGVPTGTVQFFAEGQPLGIAPLINGQATLSSASLSMGSHKIQADYSGDQNFTASVGTANEKVGKAASTVVLTSSANPGTFGQAIILTAAVTDSEGTTATGPVVFAEGATVYGTVSLAGGAAQLSVSNLTAGTHKIVAQYAGDSTDASGNSPTLKLVVNGGPTATTLSTSAQPSSFGQMVIFTAAIGSSSGSPDGTVTFKNGSSVLATVSVTNGSAQLSVNTLTVGTHTVSAIYSGSTSFAASTGSVQQIVEKVATVTVLTSSPNPAPTGQSVTLTATVTSSAPQEPTGNVTFKDGKTTLGTVALVNGQAQLSTSLLTTGTHTITASYAASTNFTASNTTLTQTMQ